MYLTYANTLYNNVQWISHITLSYKIYIINAYILELLELLIIFLKAQELNQAINHANINLKKKS